MSDEQANARELYKMLGTRLHLLEMQVAQTGITVDPSVTMEVESIKTQRAALFSTFDIESIRLLNEMSAGQHTQMIQTQQVMAKRELSDQMTNQLRDLEQRLMDRLSDQSKQQTWALNELEGKIGERMERQDERHAQTMERLSWYGMSAALVVVVVATIIITIAIERGAL